MLVLLQSLHISGMIAFARDYNRKNKAVPADPGCSSIPGFPYTLENQDTLGWSQVGVLITQVSLNTFSI